MSVDVWVQAEWTAWGREKVFRVHDRTLVLSGIRSLRYPIAQGPPDWIKVFRDYLIDTGQLPGDAKALLARLVPESMAWDVWFHSYEFDEREFGSECERVDVRMMTTREASS